MLERRGKAELASFQADPSTNQATTGCTVSDPVLLNSVDPDPKLWAFIRWKMVLLYNDASLRRNSRESLTSREGQSDSLPVDKYYLTWAKFN